jgi:hypothetical protein
MKYVDKEKPPRQVPGGQESSIGWTSALQRIAALSILDFGGDYVASSRSRVEPAAQVRRPSPENETGSATERQDR